MPTWIAAPLCGVLGLVAGVLIAGDAGDTTAADAKQWAQPLAELTVPAAVATPVKTKTAAYITPEADAIAEAPVEDATGPLLDETPLVLLDEAKDHNAPPRRRTHRRKRKAKTDDLPAFEPVVMEEPAPRPEKPAPPSASALLKQARVSFARGDVKTAYRIAHRSNKLRPSDGAAALMARAACRRADTAAALKAVRQLPLLQRSPIRKDCRRHGNRIGLIAKK